MTPFSLSFIFFFLPLTLLVFAIVPSHYRSFVLLVASLLFFATNSPAALGVMCTSLLIDYFLSKYIFSHRDDRLGRGLLYLVSAKNILLIVVLSVLGQLNPADPNLLRVSILGVTVYSLTSLGYIIDLYNGEADPILSIYDFFVFCCFFGKIQVGPLVSSRDFCPQLRHLRPSLTSMGDGWVWFCHGLAKKVILADSILLLGNQLKAIPYSQKTVLGIWLLVLCYLFAAYFTLSGYSDMARGLGAFFDITLPENFHYPLQSNSVTDFFSNFNISANRFIRKYVYRALGAEDNGRIATTTNIMLITMLMGLWYGISLNFLAWGALLGVFIVIETLLGDRMLAIPAFLRRTGTIALLVVSFTVFSTTTLNQAWNYLKAMFGLQGMALFDSHLLYLLLPNILLLVFCGVFSTGFFSRRGRRLQHSMPVLEGIFSLLANLGMFFISLSFLV